MTDIANQPLTTLLPQLTYNPLYILTVIIAFGVLIFLKDEKGCLMFFYKCSAVVYIIIYLLAIYFCIAFAFGGRSQVTNTRVDKLNSNSKNIADILFI
ncbi:hypothetical protein [Paenisporosarcina sp. NPDC076898]|uniref:hypothetical protein n=1 Tax=unclassified Paenisporosarcina TaxID=2642018 RepID=UPI003D079A65